MILHAGIFKNTISQLLYAPDEPVRIDQIVHIAGDFIASLIDVDTVVLALFEQNDEGLSCETAVWQADGKERSPPLGDILAARAADVFPLVEADGQIPAAAVASLFGSAAVGPLLMYGAHCVERQSAVLLVHRAQSAWQRAEKRKLTAVCRFLANLYSVRVLLKKERRATTVLNTVLDHLQTNIYITDLQTHTILYMNESMKKTFNLAQPEGQVCWQVLQRGMKSNCPFCPVGKLSAAAVPAVYQWEELNTVTGRTYHNYDSLISWIDGTRVHLQQSVDITDLKSANTDELTHLLTRRPGKIALAETLTQTRQTGSVFTVCLYDINMLKWVNDRYGHAEGDNLIASIAAAVQDSLAEGEYAFRLSGDEFIVVLLTDLQNSRLRLDAVLQRLKNGATPYERSFCYGLVEIGPDDAFTMEEILSAADERMYEQKRQFHILFNDRRRKAQLPVPGHADAFVYDTQRLYNALVQSTDAYLYVCNLKTGVFRYPPAMVQEFGLPGEVVENAAAVWGERVHKDDKALFLESNQEIADGRVDSHCIEYRAKNRHGRWVRVRCRGHLERDENGSPSLFAGFITKLGDEPG